MVRIHLAIDLQYEINPPGADFIFNVQAAHTPQQTVVWEELQVSQPVPLVMHTDAATRTRTLRLSANPGALSLRYRATLDIAHHVAQPDGVFETPVAQLDPGKGKTHRAYLWAYRSTVLETGPPIVVFDYQISRAGCHAKAFLADWRGHLMVDDFKGYKALFAAGVTELGCMAHSRRKFFDLNAAQTNSIALEALNRIAALYAIEHQGKDMDVAARTQWRREQAQPLLDSLHAWLRSTRVMVADGSSTARAMDYSINRWAALSRYAADGRLPIDNNAVENTIRPIAISRKNWLFTGSERAGQRAAAIQT